MIALLLAAALLSAPTPDAPELVLEVPVQGCTSDSWLQVTTPDNKGVFELAGDVLTLKSGALPNPQDNRFTVQSNSPGVEPTECTITGTGTLTLDGVEVEPYQRALAEGGKNLQVTWRAPEPSPEPIETPTLSPEPSDPTTEPEPTETPTETVEPSPEPAETPVPDPYVYVVDQCVDGEGMVITETTTYYADGTLNTSMSYEPYDCSVPSPKPTAPGEVPTTVPSETPSETPELAKTGASWVGWVVAGLTTASGVPMIGARRQLGRLL